MKILHIGYPKTGTTFLQTRLFGPLAISGKIQAYIGNDGQVGRGFTKDRVHVSLKRLGRNNFTSTQVSDLENFIENEPSFLISIEGILGSFNESELVPFSDRISRFFPPETEIVITVRDLEFYFDSWYQQRVKTDFIVSPEDLFFPTGDLNTVPVRKSTYQKFTKFDLDSLVSALLKNFNKVTLIDARLPGYQNWLSDRLGVSIEELKQLIQRKESSNRGRNESLTPELVRLLEWVNGIFRLVFRLTGIKGVWKEQSREEILQLSFTNQIRYFLVLAAIKLKRRVQEVVRISNRFYRKGRKYRLPMETKEKILNQIPESKLLIDVRNAGGVLTLSGGNS